MNRHIFWRIEELKTRNKQQRQQVHRNMNLVGHSRDQIL